MLKVVVIEDENLVRKGLILTTPWEELGCEVIGEAVNGVAGLRLVKQSQPDIVITDIRMPGLNGLRMIERLRKISRAEFIIISGYSEFEYAQQAVSLGVKDYLLKPIHPEKLHQVIRRVVQEVRKQKNLQKLQDGLDSIQESRVMLFKEYLLHDEVDSKEHYVRAAIDYIKGRYQQNINIAAVAEHLQISKSYLFRIFKAETHYTFIEYLTYFRIKKAIELLKNKTVKIYEIAGLVGYQDYRYFSAIFKRYVGINPSEFKEGLNKN
jgi:two-component system response regulator YesN